jgi:DNA-directed RNA polymerase specialized sigma24 family protein
VSEQASVTHWIEGLKGGQQDAARQLWERYFQRLVNLVRRKLPAHQMRAFDEEDVALSAFQSFCAGVGGDRFPELEDRDNLWRVLLVIALRKVQAYVRAQNRQKRGGGLVRGESGVASPDVSHQLGGLDACAGEGPTPEAAAQVAEECERLLAMLPDDALRTIATLKMQGHTIDEIGQMMGCTSRMVKRRLEIIRRTWGEAVSEEKGD